MTYLLFVGPGLLSKLCSLTDLLDIIMLVACSTLSHSLSIPVFQWPNHFGYPFLAVSAFAYLGMWPPLLPWRRHLAFGAKMVNMLNPMVIHDSVRFGVNRKIFLGYPEGPSKYYSQQKFRLHIWRHEISQNLESTFRALHRPFLREDQPNILKFELLAPLLTSSDINVNLDVLPAPNY